MAKKNKTTETEKTVSDFVDALNDEAKRKDSYELIKIIKRNTSLEPKIWGTAIIGFGSYHYKYESGREGDSPLIAFSPRASSIALYFSGSFRNREDLLGKLGKHKTEKGCVHIKTLSDIDSEVLAQMVENHIEHIKALYPDKKQ
jgi:hypothetical protein